jgi:hypothetical protein
MGRGGRACVYGDSILYSREGAISEDGDLFRPGLSNVPHPGDEGPDQDAIMGVGDLP